MKKTNLILLLLPFLVSASLQLETSLVPAQKSPIFLGIVSSASPEATQVGMEILEKGGNAMDAAIAISFALAVTEPAMSGLGGGTQILLSLPNKLPVAINGTTFSPVHTPRDATAKDLTYHRRSTIPSTVKTLEYAWEKYGSEQLNWRTLLKPAIHYAENGFVMGAFRHKVYRKNESTLRKSPHHISFFLMPDGSIPAPGDTLRQPVLAKTLLRLSTHGADDFYNGDIAKLIAADMERNGGWIRLEDLNNMPDPIELPAVHTVFRTYDVYSQPPPCGGWTVLMILNLLENQSPKALQYGTQSRFEQLLKALYIAHKNRKEVPVEDLENHKKAIAQKMSKEYALNLLKNYQSPIQYLEKESGGETTHFSVVDKDGMVVAVTASINAYFGAKAASSDLGFLYNTYMNDFELGQPKHPFAIRPSAMAYSSMSPTIVQEEGESVLVIGSPGSARIISTVAQLIQLWVDTDLGIEKIVGLPRFHSVNGRVYIENINETPNKWLQNLRKEGFEIAFPKYDLEQAGRNAYFGGVHAIAKENGQWVGVADVRRDGLVKK